MAIQAAADLGSADERLLIAPASVEGNLSADFR
jgi:hypothetical protein